MITLVCTEEKCPEVWLKHNAVWEKELFKDECTDNASKQTVVKALVTHFGVRKGLKYEVKEVEEHENYWEVDLGDMKSHIPKKHFSAPIKS